MPSTHRVIDIPVANGRLDALVLAERPMPLPAAHEVLIEVHAAGVNRADVMQRYGTYPMPPTATTVPGLEVAGVVAGCGAGVARWQVGDRVCALVFDGGYAEYCIAPAVQCLPVPAQLSLVEAAALPEVVLTVWISVIEQAQLLTGETLLVHGGASGVGSMAIQIASAYGSPVIATAGSAERCAACLGFGAELAINYHAEEFVAAVRAHTAGQGVDVILDMVGASYAARNIALLKIAGRLCYVAFPEGHAATVDLREVTMRRLKITGVNLRHQPIAEKGRLIEAVEKRVWPLIERGRVKPVVGVTVPFTEAARAHQMLEASQVIGKAIPVMR
ncbi:MAG: NAD(P)H-quinone oxidoreductase [Proteobacteria bacterium]|nr:NAD(P)H-quinone oxidoreductase [Pseudomonadota bacterium]MBI3499222.1 NAD(P)H-quinone oxidoreductase [Pseudomonadota bacterium]